MIVFAAKTILWFRKFLLGHLEVFSEKMKMSKTWSKDFQILHQAWKEFKTVWSQENSGYLNATYSAFVMFIVYTFILIFLLTLCIIWLVILPTSLSFSIWLLIPRRKGIWEKFLLGLHLFKRRYTLDVVNLWFYFHL